MVVEFYYDVLSQPCRAVYIFFKAAGIPFEAKEIDLLKGRPFLLCKTCSSIYLQVFTGFYKRYLKEA